MEKKQNSRLDHLLHLLLKINREKVFDRIQKTQIGKLSHRISQINKRHRAGLNVSKTTINCHSPTKWKVNSATQETYYIVENISMPDSCSCKIGCANCNACVHAYSCTCMDYLIHATVCKLIHAVHMIYSEISAYQGHDNTSTIENSSGNDQASSGIFTEESSTSVSADTETISSLQYLTQVSNHSTSDDILAMREVAINMCKKLELIYKIV